MLDVIIKKIFSKYFQEWDYKFVYLHNELLISIYKWNEFVFYWVKIKADKLATFVYSWENSKLLKILDLIFINYKKIFIDFLNIKKKNFSNFWDESEFINIFDKDELSYSEVKNKLDFTFLDDYSYRRRKEMSFELEQSYVEIYHSDFECSICDWPKESFTNFPDYSKKVDYKYYPENENLKQLHFNTYITDYESISIWWNPKVSEILWAKEIIDSYDTVTLNKTCISVIMWDDIESIFKYNNIPDEKTIYTDQNIDSWYKSVINFLKNIKVKNFDEENDKNTILFFWLTKTKNTYELVEFLKNNFWIFVDKILIPNINKDDLESILKYRLSIFFDSLDSKTQSVFKMYPINNIDSNIPYWITSLEKLVSNILLNIWEDINISKDFFSWIRKIMTEKLSETNKYTIWFIIHPFHVKSFNENNFRWIPIIDLLNDMWFKYKFFIYDNNNLQIYKNDLDLFIKSWYNYKISSNKDDLFSFIWDENINLIYSEISNDKRILDFWKVQFSVWDFEYWLEWFYRTIDKMLLKCKKQDYYTNLFNLNGK